MTETTITISHTLFAAPEDQLSGPTPVDASITVDPSVTWPDCLRVALLWLAATADKTQTFPNRDDAREFIDHLNQPQPPITGLITTHPLQLDKEGDQWRILRLLSHGPKPVAGEPPHSACPRCGKPLWDGVTDNESTLLYMRNPYPQYCLNCGQRYRYDDGQLAYTADIDWTRWTRRLGRENDIQPTLAQAV